MKHSFTALCVFVACCCVASTASAQWGYSPAPSSGACFYEDINYGGRYFCARVGSVDHPGAGRDEQRDLLDQGVRQCGGHGLPGHRSAWIRQALFLEHARPSWCRLERSDFILPRRPAIVRERQLGWRLRRWQLRRRLRRRLQRWLRRWGLRRRLYGGEWGHSGGSRLTHQQAQEIVRRAYRSVLDRDPDPAASGWVNEVMKNNWSQQDLEAQLRNSQEYRDKNRRR